jgi:MoCo/4Fe-4S cofactor protein with predicted Tat translocation signal
LFDVSSLTDKPTPSWRSLAELEADPAFDQYLANQFPEQKELLKSPLSRRRFMQLMGASTAFAAATGCHRWERENVAPLSSRPEGYIPAVPQHYATAFEVGGLATSLLVTCYDGRPVKIEGNPDHPSGVRATTGYAQASILELYDPDRAGGVRRRDGNKVSNATWDDFAGFIRDLVASRTGAGGKGLRILAEASQSPTLAGLRARLLTALPQVRWHEWEPLSRDNERVGLGLAFGSPYRVQLNLAQADTVVAIDADLFATDPGALELSRDFARRRDPAAGQMNRLYAIESAFTTTGGMADHRLPLRSELALPLLLAVEAQLFGGSAPQAAFLNEGKVPRFLAAMVSDLRNTQGRSALVVGCHQAPAVHAVAARINARLGNAGAAVRYLSVTDPARPSHVEDISALARDIQGGQVDALLIFGGNPAYDAPVDLGFAELLGKIPATVHLSTYYDETSERCTWHLPRAHYLESWGDSRTADGTVVIQQPMIEPLHGGRSVSEVLALLLEGRARSGAELVRETCRNRFALATDAAWRKAIHDGFVEGTADQPVTPPLQSLPQFPLSEAQLGGLKASNGNLELVFTPSSATYDGRFANNGWLQEAPDFMTKLTWDNAALIGPATASALGVKQADLVELTVGSQTLAVPAYVMPGQAAGSIALALGYGRTRAGHVGGMIESAVAAVGTNSYKLRTTAALHQASGVKVRATGRQYPLATTQEHWAMDARGQETVQIRSREFIQQAALTRYRDKPDFVKDAAHTEDNRSLVAPRDADQAELSLFQEHKYPDHRWGMSTDLSKCIGCNSCVLACQSENNIPIVGKEQVIANREMHWIRIDRYFIGSPDEPQLAHQPVACQQCENAPCEQVCPVGATIHSSEGLNDMAYNRCVGTRYCSNNCPYKVRRFNFLDWHKGISEPKNDVRRLLFNPEVTVRSRGVMEKCTFCVQRIQSAKIKAKNAGRAVSDGDIVPACAQACPTEAIVFGDLNDNQSAVAQNQAQPRAYTLLSELNTKPRNAYLARIRNPHPDLG